MSKKLYSLFLSLVMITTLLVTPVVAEDGATETTAPSMSVTFLDIGHGDAAVIESNGHFMMIDAGMYKYIDRVTTFLNSRNVEKFDLFVSSHWDGDHCGGFNQLLKSYPVDTMWFSDYYSDKKSESTLVDNIEKSMKENGCKAYTPTIGETYQVGDATVEVIYDGRNPEKICDTNTNEALTNDASLVVKVTCAGKSALFAGDARSEVEDSLPASKVNCDILKLSHHGTYFSTSNKFIKNTSPQYAAMSLEDGDRTGGNAHIVFNLSEAGVVVNRTDKEGNITYNVTKDDIEVVTQKQVGSIKKASITNILNAYKYTGKAIVPDVKVTYGGKELYTVDSKPCFETPSKTACYHFDKKCKSLSKCDPKYITATTAGACMAKGKRACGNCKPGPYDIKIECKNNVKKGTATITIYGLTYKCAGKVSYTFEINETGEQVTAGGAAFTVLSKGAVNAVAYTGPSNKAAASVSIPATVKAGGKTYKVTEIEANAFKGCTGLKSVVIGKNVKKIGKKAFYGCKKLKKVTIKSTKIKKKGFGKNAFKKIGKKAVIKVPKKKYKAYKKYLKKSKIDKGTKIKK